MKAWIFRTLFPELEQKLRLAEGVERKYVALANTIDARSPLDESELMRRFVSLDSDYTALESQWRRATVELRAAQQELRALKRTRLGWGELWQQVPMP